MHAPRIKDIHCLGHLSGSSRTPVEHARAHPLSPSLHSCNVLPLVYKRESRGPFQGTCSDFLLFPFSLLLGGKDSLIFFPSSNLQPSVAQKLQRLGIKLRSRPFVTHTTNQRK
jgi:hypothetical protein